MGGGRGIRSAGAAARRCRPGGRRCGGVLAGQGARELTPARARSSVTLRCREQQAERLDRPPFRVMGRPPDGTHAPRAWQAQGSAGVPGMTPGRSAPERRAAGDSASLDAPPRARPRPIAAGDVQDRCDRLHLAQGPGAGTGHRTSSCRARRSGSRQAPAWTAGELAHRGLRPLASETCGMRFSRCSVEGVSCGPRPSSSPPPS